LRPQVEYALDLSASPASTGRQFENGHFALHAQPVHSPFLLLPADFHSSDACDAGLDLINRLQSLLRTPAKL
jgi:hypothetical protein